MVAHKLVIGTFVSMISFSINAEIVKTDELIFKFQTDPDLKFLNFSEVKGSLKRVRPEPDDALYKHNLTDTTLLSDYDLLRQTIKAPQTVVPGLTDTNSHAPGYQANPFDTPIDINLKGPNTVGEAVAKILHYIGYDLKPFGVGIDPTAATIFAKPIPVIHRVFEQVSVKEAICALIGPGYTVVIDNAIRVVSADVSPEKRRILSMEQRLKGGLL